MHHGAARYRQAERVTLSARETEISAFSAVIRALETASAPAERIAALGRTHALWSALVKDLALSENRLPAALKAQLTSLGLWAMRASTQLMAAGGSTEALIEVNRNVLDGLLAQGGAAASGMPEVAAGIACQA